MDIEEVKKSWMKRGFSFATGTIKAGDAIHKASHEDKDELVMMEAGSYEFTLDDNAFTQAGKEEVFIPAGVTHSIKNLSDRDATIFYGYRPKVV